MTIGRLTPALVVAVAQQSEFEPVAGNGLLYRRALLMQGAAFAGGLSAVAGLRTTAVAAEPLAEADWSLTPGDAVPAYQTPPKYAKDVVRSLSNPDFEPHSSQSRTPHQRLDGMLIPNGVFFCLGPRRGRSPTIRSML